MFKFGFQHLNVPNPNASNNTCLFALFEEAPDSYTNLQICLGRYKKDIEELQGRTWRYSYLIPRCNGSSYSYTINRGKKVRIFLCGDYEFLCRLFGLSGASG